MRLRQKLAAQFGRSSQNRTAAEKPGGQSALQRLGIGGERHPRRLHRRHHAVLGDRDKQEVQKIALVLGRLMAGQQQMEIFGKTEPSHQVIAEIATAHFDAVRPGGANSGDRRAGFADMHGASPGLIFFGATDFACEAPTAAAILSSDLANVPAKQVPEKCVTVFRQKPATKQEAEQAKRGRSHASLLRLGI